MVEPTLPAPTFQSTIMVLERFWASYGCLIWQPHNHQVGAGTMNPATALRVLGPEPWKVSYVEPSIRPDDGRYGDNPNRLQQHYQYQVIIKPEPGDAQMLYLESLEALGIKLCEHDIRFVEDNWEQPAIGAWGLGWEVWLDGQEITQFTYLQQLGGLTLDPVSVELTYGLERILIALQRVKGFREIQWTEDITYGDLNLHAEKEYSRYYFELANVESLRSLYDLYRGEAEIALDSDLLLPAYDFALRCSHTFNVLDTRGAVGVTERARYFRNIRKLVRQIAEQYVNQRKRSGFPFLEKASTASVDLSRESIVDHEHPASYLIEIGVEELPASDLDHALAQLEETVPDLLAEYRLSHGVIHVFGTPRRLAVLVEDLSPCQLDSETMVRGPAARDIYDRDGNPTSAAQGFARSKGIEVEELEVRKTNGGEYVFALVKEMGKPVTDLLVEIGPEIVCGLSFKKTMRWRPGDDSVTFSRPIRWLVSLLGTNVMSFSYAGIVAGRESRGPLPLGANPVTISDANDYQDLMSEHQIMITPAERREFIAAEAQLLASEVGGDIIDDPELLSEIANLVENPTVFRGDFDAHYLELPQEVLASVMKKHQRYFPVTKNGLLLPCFIGVRNGDKDNIDLVIEGNEHVIRARFSDASYFVGEDLKQPLESFRPKLALLTFQERLGSMLDKSERIKRIVADLARPLRLDERETETALRAAHLAKADLAAQMVVEMTSLQGVIGREYALRSGESVNVARAIEEHYWPKGVGGPLPESLAGIAVGLADRLDSLVGLFAAGLIPSGSSDPFGLRRAALGVVQILLDRSISLDLRIILHSAAKLQPLAVEAAVMNEVEEFITRRLRVVLGEYDYRHDVVASVLDAQAHDPYRTQQAAAQLTDWSTRKDWIEILDAYARCVRILPKHLPDYDFNESRLVEDAERNLWTLLQSVQSISSVDDFFTEFVSVIPAITGFFDGVLVMDEDSEVRANRLWLLQRIAGLADGILDLSKMDGF